MRRLIIEETHPGVYRVARGHDLGVTGPSVENALLKAAAQSGIKEPEVRSTFDMAELLDSLMGPKRDVGGQIVEGVASA